MLHPYLRQPTALVLSGAVLITGCTKTVTHRIARYHPGDAPTTRPVTDVAVYKVKVYDRQKKKYRGIDGTEQVLRAGDVVGFLTDEQGIVHAVVNDNATPLAVALKPEHKMVWYAQYEKQTQFGKEFGKALGTTGTVIGTAAVLGVVGVGIGAGLSLNDHDDCRDDRSHHHHHTHD